MSKQEKKGLVPALRFPEFKGAEEWISERFDEIYELKVTNSLSRDKLNYENGVVKNIHYGDIHTKFSTLFNIKKEQVPFINSTVPLDKIKPESYCQESDMVFADASEDIDDIGKSIELVNLDSEKLLAGLHTLLARQIDNKLVTGFGGHLFKSILIRKQIRKEAQGAKVLGISAGRISSINIAYHSDKPEQQKIADCLSSIDELVTAQSQKLDALKAHKKGLMQQLFTVEGETVPKRRFPEFRERGGWAETRLSNVVQLISGLHLSPTEHGTSGITPYFTGPSDFTNKQFDISKWTNSGTAIAVEQDILITVKGSGVGQLWYLLLPSVAMGRQLMAIRSDHCVGRFLYQLLSTKKSLFEVLGAGNMIPGLSRPVILGVTLWLPSLQEQQKIADCLSSIDELITAQSQKIELLKAHKKGLMQQLFPTVEEVGA